MVKRGIKAYLPAIWLFAVAVCAYPEAQLLLAIDLSRTPDHSGKVYMATIDRTGKVGQAELVIADAERIYLAERGGHFVYRTKEGQWLRGKLEGQQPTLVPVALPESMDEREVDTFDEIQGIALSNSGRQAAWVGPRMDGEDGGAINLSDLETGRTRTLVTSEEFGWCGLITWSPDHTRLAFHAKNRQAGSTLMVYDLVANRVFAVAPRSLPISRGDGVPTSPRWSPDGSRIMFSARYEGDPSGPFLYVAPAAPWSEDAAASGLTRVSGLFADWSSDGTSVVRLRETGRQGHTFTDVLTRQSVEGEAVGTTEDLGQEFVVNFARLRGGLDPSPGGRYVAYSILNDEGTATAVVVFDSESGTYTEVLTVPGLCGYEPRWFQMRN